MTATPKFQFETIVVAADYSDTSSAARRYAQAVAKSHRAKLVITHIIDPVDLAFQRGEPECIRNDKTAHKEVLRIEDETRTLGIPVHSASESELICGRILESVRDNHADLLSWKRRLRPRLGIWLSASLPERCLHVRGAQ